MLNISIYTHTLVSQHFTHSLNAQIQLKGSHCSDLTIWSCRKEGRKSTQDSSLIASFLDACKSLKFKIVYGWFLHSLMKVYISFKICFLKAVLCARSVDITYHLEEKPGAVFGTYKCDAETGCLQYFYYTDFVMRKKEYVDFFSLRY